ncbi:hypothetical protein SAMN05660912_03309 [Pseudomonas sp. LAMO17WK12:I1]|jgi:hypothetical protein|nr:hypothetical protein SAMN05660912_03309 [Pseudomonas sp. LAMO17WK12:I1]
MLKFNSHNAYFHHQYFPTISIERSAISVCVRIFSLGIDVGGATAATPATTHVERGLEHGDKSGDSRHFLSTSAVTLDRLFEWV